MAVKLPTIASYTIEGKIDNPLYPISVKQDGDDVFIQMKESAPIPEVYILDRLRNATKFNFKIEGTKLIIPGKFKHLRLRYKGAEEIDIILKKI